MARVRKLIVTEQGGEELNRLLGLIVSPVGKTEAVRYGSLTGCWVEPAGKDVDVYKRRLSAAVAGYIVRHWVRAFSDAIISRKYRSLTPVERARVMHHANYRLRSSLGRIAGLLADYVNREQVLIVEGFATFRVPGLRQDVEDAVDEGVDSVMLDREYRSFLDVVASVVKRQPPRAGTVHVYLDGKGKFFLAEQTGKPLTVPGITPGDWAGEGARNRHDMLIGALVAVSPEKVMIHDQAREHRCRYGVNRGELLQAVFGSRIEFCPGCDDCRGS